eukprot:EG_transcript_16322
MGRDRAWKTSFPEHLRRSRSRKPKWQKKLSQKSKELAQNLEKLENRIFSKRRQQKMREARMAARQEMEAASFPQFNEADAAAARAELEAKRRAPVIPRLEDPDEDIYVPSEASDDDSDAVAAAARRRQDRLAVKKLKRQQLRDPLGLDEEAPGAADVTKEVAADPKPKPKPKPQTKVSADNPSKPASAAAQATPQPNATPPPAPAGKKATPKPAAKPPPKPKEPKVEAPSASGAPPAPAAPPRRQVGPGTALLKKRQRDFESVVSPEADEEAERPHKRPLTAHERRQLKKARKQPAPASVSHTPTSPVQPKVSP